MTAAPVPRWAISFADIGLILLGCFVMLHALEAARPKAAAESAHAGPAFATLIASDLFAPGDARLTEEGRAHVRDAAARLSGRAVAIRSLGTDGESGRLDRVELAAARTAAISREIVASGFAESDIGVSILPGEGLDAQRIEVSPRP